MASNIADLGGYDCKFVEEPPDDLICLICTFVAKDPQQVTCCGKIYCRACLEEHKKRSSVCPQCRKSGTSFEDKKSNRAIKQLKVKCNNIDNRCKWIGQLCNLDNHLKKCQYQLVPCPNECTEEDNRVKVLRKELAKHLKSHCNNRLVSCVHCKEKGKYIDIMTTHFEECQKVEILCTNEGCEDQIPREDLFSHRHDYCRFERLLCKYFHIGCTTELLRKDRESHESNDQLHLHLAIETISKMQSGIVSTSTAQNGFTFKMANFENHKTKDMRYLSPPFYTKPGGYKMCIRVDANGWKGNYKKSVSAFIYFMRGENDDNLVWPFTGTVAITLLNQLQDNRHYTCELNYAEDENNDDDNDSDSDDDNDQDNNRVMVEDMADSGYGFSSFIPHSDLGYKPALNRQYLKDDCLFFKVKVKAPEPIKPWLTCSK